MKTGYLGFECPLWPCEKKEGHWVLFLEDVQISTLVNMFLVCFILCINSKRYTAKTAVAHLFQVGVEAGNFCLQ